jgi:tetratricopeptide (TPR) repeat protein
MDDRTRFLMDSFQLIEQIQGNAEQLYAFWRNNLHLIDGSLVRIVPDFTSQLLRAQSNKEQQISIASALGQFGNLMQRFPIRNQGITIELAIASYQTCVSIFTRSDRPRLWATSQMGLGTAYFERIAGERKENIELAIAACRASLEVYTRQAFPVAWATSQMVLGTAYFERIAGERKENIELAIAACRASLEVHTRQAFPVQWATSQMDLGAAYNERILGERKENIELAIAAYRASLEVFTRQAFPVEWARSKHNLVRLEDALEMEEETE